MLDMKHPFEGTEEVVVHHRLWRKAPHIAIGIGILAGTGLAVGYRDAPWWMPFFAGGILAILVYRILRPRLRKPTIEDEI